MNFNQMYCAQRANKWCPNDKKLFEPECTQFFTQSISKVLIDRMTAEAAEPVIDPKGGYCPSVIAQATYRRENRVREQLRECITYAKAQHKMAIVLATKMAVTLGTHSRVGANSPFRQLDDNIIRMIMCLV